MSELRLDNNVSNPEIEELIEQIQKSSKNHAWLAGWLYPIFIVAGLSYGYFTTQKAEDFITFISVVFWGVGGALIAALYGSRWRVLLKTCELFALRSKNR